MNSPAQATWRWADAARFPRTRYQGSKRKLTASILHHLDDLSFSTVLDAMGGTGSVSYALKCSGKRVTYNDLLTFNHQIGLALIENDTVRLSIDEIDEIGRRLPGIPYGDLIERTFEGIYFTSDENRWLDVAVENVRTMACRFKRALAWYALCQAAMAKRPYNLFHRANLYMRTADVTRSFGNKASWDRSFADHVGAFARQANQAIIDGAGSCRATCGDALAVGGRYDLVYLDPPYVNSAGIGVDFRDFYHFLEGMVRYDDWAAMIDHKSKHRRLRRQRDAWSDAGGCRAMFETFFERFKESILVVSYRSDGIPSIEELTAMLGRVKRHVRVIEGDRYQYALSTRRDTREVLLIGMD